MWAVDHTSSDLLLLLVVVLLGLALAHFSHLLKIEEAAEGIGMCLSLHHS